MIEAFPQNFLNRSTLHGEPAEAVKPLAQRSWPAELSTEDYLRLLWELACEADSPQMRGEVSVMINSFLDCRGPGRPSMLDGLRAFTATSQLALPANTVVGECTMLTVDPSTEERPLTYEEERGKPMPSRNHAIIEMNLGMEFAKHREFRVLPEVTLELFPGDWKVPDLSVYPHEPMDLRHDVARPTEPPLLTVEIVSPSQGMQEIMDKVDFYHAHGVKSVWVIVPPLRQVTIFLADGSQQTHLEGLVRDPATGLTADLEAVFA